MPINYNQLTSVFSLTCVCVCACACVCEQELAAAERVKRQAQQERDELQDEINNQASKK